MSDNSPVLYSFRRCPYAMRARLAVTVSGQKVKLREVVLREKPDHMLEISPKGTVPVLLLDDGAVFEESRDIMHWALENNDPDGWFLPSIGNLEDMIELVDLCDTDFKHHLDRYKYHTRYEGADPLYHRSEAERFLKLLNKRLDGQEFLFGDRFSFADAAIVPFIRQFANASRDWFPGGHENVQRWLMAFLESDLFKSIMPKFPQWHLGDAEIIFPVNK